MPAAPADITRLEVWTQRAGQAAAEKQPALAGSITINMDLSGRSTARWERIVDTSASGDTPPNVGDTVEIRGVIDGGTPDVLFGGSVEIRQDELNIEQPLDQARFQYTATDWRRHLDRRLVNDEYSNMTLREIVAAIIADYGFTDEGFTLAAGLDGRAIDVAYNYVSAERAISESVALAGYLWRVTPDKEIVLFARSTEVSPWPGSATRRAWSKISLRQDLMDYRSKQYIRGWRTTTQLTESIISDGSQRRYPLLYQIANLDDSDAIAPIVRVGATQEDVAEAGVALPPGETVQWRYTPGVAEIVRESTASVLAAGVVVSVTYHRPNPGILTVTLAEAFLDPPLSTLGLYERASEEAEYTSESEARKYAAALLARYGTLAPRVQIDTRVSGLNIGELVTLDESAISLDGTYVVDRLVVRDDGQIGAIWTATLIDTTAGRWREFWSDSVHGGLPGGPQLPTLPTLYMIAHAGSVDNGQPVHSRSGYGRRDACGSARDIC